MSCAVRMPGLPRRQLQPAACGESDVTRLSSPSSSPCESEGAAVQPSTSEAAEADGDVPVERSLSAQVQTEQRKLDREITRRVDETRTRAPARSSCKTQFAAD